jgi:hypothetical protein
VIAIAIFLLIMAVSILYWRRKADKARKEKEKEKGVYTTADNEEVGSYEGSGRHEEHDEERGMIRGARNSGAPPTS